MSEKVIAVSTCKGRLAHVKQTSKSFLKCTPENFQYLLVDYGCPDHTGDWVTTNLGNTGRAHSLILKPKDDLFHKSISLNTGIRYAIDTLGANYIIHIDADTIVKNGFADQILPLHKKEFVILQPSEATKDLTGLIVFHKNMFEASGGFDESFQGWGGEDIDFRLRLYAQYGYMYKTISKDFLSVIKHDDSLRVKFYHDDHHEVSNSRHMKIMKRKFLEYRGEDLGKLQKLKDRFEISQLIFAKPFESLNTKNRLRKQRF